MFKVTVQEEGSYNFMDPSERSIPASVEWDGGKIRVHFSPEEHGVEDLRDMEWHDLATLVAETITKRYLLHADKAKAEELFHYLADDPHDEKLIAIQDAEEEHRLPGIVREVQYALSALSAEGRKRVLEEVA